MALQHDRFRDPGTWMFGICRDDVVGLLVEWDELRAENERLRDLLGRWVADCPEITHNIAGQPISLVQDTLIALGREPLKPLGRD